MRSILRWPAVIVSATLLFAACGGDDDDVTASDESSSDDSSSDEGSSEDDSASDDDAPLDDTEGSGNDFSGSGSGDLCEFAQEIEAAMGDEFLSSTDPDVVDEQYNELNDILGEAVDRAPDEIRPDLEIVADGLRSFIDVLAEYDYDFVALAEDPEALEALSSLEGPEFDEASLRVEEYFTEVCGIE